MMYVYLGKAYKTTQTKKGLRFNWYETPMFLKEEDSLKHINWYINNNKKYRFSHIEKRTVY